MKNKLLDRSNNFYVRILLYLTITISLTIFIVSIVLYFNFENIGLSLLYSFSKDSLTQVSYSATYMDDTIKSLATQIYLNNDTSKLLYISELDPFDISNGLNRLSSYKSSMSIIYSIYLFNKNSNTYYTNLASNSVQDKDTFFDRDIVQMLEDFPPEKRLKPITRKLSEPYTLNGQNPYSNVYTYVFYDYPSRDKQIKSAVVLNVSEEWMRKTINSIDNMPGNSTIIIDAKGMTVCGNKQAAMMTDLSNKEYIKDIIGSKDHSGHFVKTVDGVKSLITFVSSENLGWIFVRITPYNIVLNQISSMKYVTIMICLIILALGLLFSYLASRSISRPIDDILSRLKEMDLAERNNILVKKQDFLKSLLQSEIPYTDEYVKKNFEKYQIKLEMNNEIVLVLLKIDFFPAFCSRYNLNDRNTMKFGIINIVTELGDKKFNCEALDFSEDNIIILFNPPALAQIELDGLLQLYVKEIQDCVKKYLDISLSVTISSPEKFALEDLYNIYVNVADASLHRLYYGHNSVIFTEKIHIHAPEQYIYPAQKEKFLIEALTLGKIDKVKPLYCEIIHSVIGYPLSIFNSAILRLTFSINMAVDNIEKSSGIRFFYNFNKFIAELNRLETINDVNNSFYDMFEHIISKINERKDDKYEALTSKVIKIIKSNYSNPILSLDYIADIVNMSSTYLGRLFKKATSKSVADYINDVRLDKAKEFLEASSYSIAEISDKVGFSSSNYFYILFKKTYGVPPSEYRQNMTFNEKA